MEYFSIRNLSKYQHYKDRNIVWIKWHLSCYQDYTFNELKPDQKWFFIGLIGLACRLGNKIPKDFEYISRMLGGDSITVSLAIEKMFDIKLLAKSYTYRIDRDRIDRDREDKIVSDKPKTNAIKEPLKEPETYKVETTLQKVVVAWKILTGVKEDDRVWDKAHWGRTAKSASALLEFFEGDHRMVIFCMRDISEKMEKLGRTYTIETILKHSSEWKVKQEKENNYGTVESKN